MTRVRSRLTQSSLGGMGHLRVQSVPGTCARSNSFCELSSEHRRRSGRTARASRRTLPHCSAALPCSAPLSASASPSAISARGARTLRLTRASSSASCKRCASTVPRRLASRFASPSIAPLCAPRSESHPSRLLLADEAPLPAPAAAGTGIPAAAHAATVSCLDTATPLLSAACWVGGRHANPVTSALKRQQGCSGHVWAYGSSRQSWVASLLAHLRGDKPTKQLLSRHQLHQLRRTGSRRRRDELDCVGCQRHVAGQRTRRRWRRPGHIPLFAVGDAARLARGHNRGTPAVRLPA